LVLIAILQQMRLEIERGIPDAWDRELKWLKNSGLPQESLEWILEKSAADFFKLF
jgi:hypothetical protein